MSSPSLPPSLAAAQRTNRRLDAVLVFAAGVIAMRSEDRWISTLLIVSALLTWWVATRVVRQYGAGSERGPAGDMALSIVAFGAVVVVVGVEAALVGAWSVVAPFALVCFAGGLVLRAALVTHRLSAAEPVDVVLVVGIGPLGRLSGKNLAQTGKNVLGYLRFDGDPDSRDRLRAPLLGAADQLERVLREHAVDEVYFASVNVDNGAAVQKSIRVCERFGVPFALPQCTYRLTRARSIDGAVQGDGYAHYCTVQHRPLELWLKRLFDIAASGLALVALAPLLLVVSVLVKVTSKGPVLYRQERVGLHGRRFDMLKFRSMVADADALKAKLLAQNEQTGPVFKMAKDPRVTAVGRFIRKFSIDELPQLVCVLRGDMSIVGPRPPLASEVAKYEGWQRRRLSVRPGLTCIWQVSGRDQIGFRDWMLLDMRYIDHWSLVRDFALILKTVPVVLTGKGAS